MHPNGFTLPSSSDCPTRSFHGKAEELTVSSLIDDDKAVAHLPRSNPSLKMDALMRSSERFQSTLNEAPSRGATPCRSLQTINVTPSSKCYTGSLLRYVSTETVAELVRSEQVSEEGAIYIIDCRYPDAWLEVPVVAARYEYNGGHIVNAMNFPPYDMESLMEFVFNDVATRDRRRAIIILHCEFSQLRAPLATDALKKIHVMTSEALEDVRRQCGYCDFFRKFKELCEPQSYTEMHGDSAENDDFRVNMHHGPQLNRGSPPPALMARGRHRKVRGNRCFDDMDLSFRNPRRRSSRLSSSSWGTTDDRDSPIRLLSDEFIWRRSSIHGKDSTVAGWCSEDEHNNTASTATTFTSAGGLKSGARRSSICSLEQLETCIDEEIRETYGNRSEQQETKTMKQLHLCDTVHKLVQLRDRIFNNNNNNNNNNQSSSAYRVTMIDSCVSDNEE